MLATAHQGYIYQDILAAYIVAKEIAQGRIDSNFSFDVKKQTEAGIDKFDDIALYQKDSIFFIQVKYSNEDHDHKLTKQDFSSSGNYDLALFDLFETWKSLHAEGVNWRICLAWDRPLEDDLIIPHLSKLSNVNHILPNTTCYKFDFESLWPDEGVVASWRALKNWSKPSQRTEFKKFLEHLVIEVECPKTSLLQDMTFGIEELLINEIEDIGIGIYPNDHMTARQAAESLFNLTRALRSREDHTRISCTHLLEDVGIIQTFGGIEQNFPIEESQLVDTPMRIAQVEEVLKTKRKVILTAEPGAGKSWFLQNYEEYLTDSTHIIKHYCYTALDDPLSIERITTNVLYGSLIQQIVQSDKDLHGAMTKRYASNLEQLNLLLNSIKKKTLIVVDGIDHIWRVYQKNRGGLTEDQTAILTALAQLDVSNTNIHLLIVSQPISQLEDLSSFCHISLQTISLEFVESLMQKVGVTNLDIDGTLLSKTILNKSQGNALYCKYILDHITGIDSNATADSVHALPQYDFNLSNYYIYIYKQIAGQQKIPHVLCGSDFSLKIEEIKEITKLGDLVEQQIKILTPILKSNFAYGYSIYHESFKRFIIDELKSHGADIHYHIYRPLILWLESMDFFKSTKAYGHLLKLYYEVDEYQKIATSIEPDFINKSLFHTQPFGRILQNHLLQKASLKNESVFAQILILSEQSKVVDQLDGEMNELLPNYFRASLAIHGEDHLYRALWDGNSLQESDYNILSFLTTQVYDGKKNVHWNIVPESKSIPYELIGFRLIEQLYFEEFSDFDENIEKIFSDPLHEEATHMVIDELEKMIIHQGDEWIEQTPKFTKYYQQYCNTKLSLEQLVSDLISSETSHLDKKWNLSLRQLSILASNSSDNERRVCIQKLSNYNWFYNWMIYLIKINALSTKAEITSEEILNAFSYLVRDLDQFKGKPRVCDLYSQLPYINKSFHTGLKLCRGDSDLLLKCCVLLEKVTELSSGIQGSVSGPLVDEAFLELINQYLPSDFVLEKYAEYYSFIKADRLYTYVAATAFDYACALQRANKPEEAEIKYKEGIQAMTGYNFRKDRSLSEILYSSEPFQQAYGTLDIEWFYELYHLSLAVVAHTDGKSTKSYPMEWFKEFIKIYPDEALKFLAAKTIENSSLHWHQENDFFHVLEEYHSLFTPTQWFLLCKSMPLASSKKILSNGLSTIDNIDKSIVNACMNWLKARPVVSQEYHKDTYPEDVSIEYEKRFGIKLLIKQEDDKNTRNEYAHREVEIPVFTSDPSQENVLAFVEKHGAANIPSNKLIFYFQSADSFVRKKEVIRNIAQSFRYQSDVEPWMPTLFEEGSDEWLYTNVCLFVHVMDGWLHGLHYHKYLETAYASSPVKTIAMLKDVLGHYLSLNNYTGHVSRNLIIALCKLGVEESQVRNLLELTLNQIKCRLPHSNETHFDHTLYRELDEFTRDEVVVTLLISRLKTLTTEKNQGIIWSLTYLAKNHPTSLFKPFGWALKNGSFLLPIQRALLLQILVESVSKSTIPDFLSGQIVSGHPSGYFIEDQFINYLCDFQLSSEKPPIQSILLSKNERDTSYLSDLHRKYYVLDKIVDLSGVYKTIRSKERKIAKDYSSYFDQSNKLFTPIVAIANASYEIVHNQYYSELLEHSSLENLSPACNLEFYLSAIILQQGSLTKRPAALPPPDKFESFEIKPTAKIDSDNDWIMIASDENKILGEMFKVKKIASAARTLVFIENPTAEDYLYSKYVFRLNQYHKDWLISAPIDQPICRLRINDFLENSVILFLSPWVIRELALSVDLDIHNGLSAVDKKGEVVVKFHSWKQEYYGNKDNGSEVPRLTGCGVFLRRDYYSHLLSFCRRENSWMVFEGN